MKNIYTNLLTLISSVTLLLYLANNQYFTPYTSGNITNWYNVTTVLITIWIAIFTSTFLISYLLKKKLAYGKKEFPPARRSYIEAGIIATLFIISLLLHIFHLLTFGWGIALSIILTIALRILL